jgi:hypothetical protein
MLARAEALGLQLPSLPRLQALMRVHQQWEQRLREMLQSGPCAFSCAGAGLPGDGQALRCSGRSSCFLHGLAAAWEVFRGRP